LETEYDLFTLILDNKKISGENEEYMKKRSHNGREIARKKLD
jgi:hypothetical protein